jgi:Kelch motif protein/galactose oxidase-like protein
MLAQDYPLRRVPVAWPLRASALLIMVMTTWGCGGGSNSGSRLNDPAGSSTRVVVAPASATVYEGTILQFKAQVVGQSDQTVAWSLEQGIGTIDSTGLFTAPRDGFGGPFHVIATSRAVPSAHGSATVSVAPVVVTITPATVTLSPGGTQAFNASVVGHTDQSVTWTVQETGGGSISNSGIYSATAAVGFFHVIATSVADPTFNGIATITITTSTGGFTPTGSMQHGRGFYTATLLGDGRVFVSGGSTKSVDPICVGGISAAELYNPAAGSFSATGNMTTARYAHSAALLPNGKVLITGGFDSPPDLDCFDGEPALSSAELFDPLSGSFQPTGSMLLGRGGHTSTLLPNGKVLVSGGGDNGGGPLPFYGTASKTAELYDPSTGRFIATGNMGTTRLGHTATLLPNGKVLIVGGTPSPLSQATIAAEIYDPATGAFTSTGSMATPRAGHTATMLSNGTVLISGGYTDFNNGVFTASSTAELYDPVTGTFSITGSMGVARWAHTATLLSSGQVLVTGGSDPVGNSLPTAEIYDPSTGSFSPTGAMALARSGHSSMLLLNGEVLVAGGGTWSPLASAELYK